MTNIINSPEQYRFFFLRFYYFNAQYYFNLKYYESKILSTQNKKNKRSTFMESSSFSMSDVHTFLKVHYISKKFCNYSTKHITCCIGA